jgi:hypothetical protein
MLPAPRGSRQIGDILSLADQLGQEMVASVWVRERGWQAPAGCFSSLRSNPIRAASRFPPLGREDLGHSRWLNPSPDAPRSSPACSYPLRLQPALLTRQPAVGARRLDAFDTAAGPGERHGLVVLINQTDALASPQPAAPRRINPTLPCQSCYSGIGIDKPRNSPPVVGAHY